MRKCLEQEIFPSAEIPSWFRFYTTDIYQVVRITGDSSEHRKVHVGVPRGSILGPLLFSPFFFFALKLPVPPALFSKIPT